MGDLEFLKNHPARSVYRINVYRFGQVIECDKLLIFNKLMAGS